MKKKYLCRVTAVMDHPSANSLTFVVVVHATSIEEVSEPLQRKILELRAARDSGACEYPIFYWDDAVELSDGEDDVVLWSLERRGDATIDVPSPCESRSIKIYSYTPDGMLAENADIDIDERWPNGFDHEPIMTFEVQRPLPSTAN